MTSSANSFLYLCGLLAMSGMWQGGVTSGPFLTNAASCEQCHMVPARFGGSHLTVQKVGTETSFGFVPSEEGGILHGHGRPFSILDYTDKITGERVSISLLGDGFVEAIDGEDLRRNAKLQRGLGLDIYGKLAMAPVLESKRASEDSKAKTSSPLMQVGRFGWKSQHSSLKSACADSLRNELGIRNALYPDEYSTHPATDPPTPLDKPDPVSGKTELERLVDEIRHTAPPAGDEKLAETPAAKAGEVLFAELGCALCHVPTYRTLPAGTVIGGGTYTIPASIGNKTIHPYSDFLLHDVGTGDGIPQAATPEYLDQSTANKFRTAPLWGLHSRTWFMHDGKAINYNQAIMRHGGEATKVRHTTRS